jgi:hypothetical protein
VIQLKTRVDDLYSTTAKSRVADGDQLQMMFGGSVSKGERRRGGKCRGVEVIVILQDSSNISIDFVSIP